MFIPLEGEEVVCLANVIALYREDGATTILRDDGSKLRSSFTPETLRKRRDEFSDKSVPLFHKSRK